MLLGDEPDLAPLKRSITGRTEGNPFFIEELVFALFDDAVPVRNGTIKVARSLSHLRIPPTSEAALAARIDRLPARHKELLILTMQLGLFRNFDTAGKFVMKCDS